jgi:hypothetical protein
MIFRLDMTLQFQPKAWLPCGLDTRLKEAVYAE